MNIEEFIKRETERNPMFKEFFKGQTERNPMFKEFFKGQTERNPMFKEFIKQMEESSMKRIIDGKRKTKKALQPALHFTRSFTETEKRNLFNGLKSRGFIPMDTNFNHFTYVFCGVEMPNNEKPFEPIIWQRKIGFLAYCIYNLFSDTDAVNIWEITTKCFLWKGKHPNKDTLKNTVCKYKNGWKKKPKGYEELYTIINTL